MKTFRLAFIITLLLTLLVSGVAYADDRPEDENTPESVNIFLVSPDPAPAGATLTIDINADMNAGANLTTSFCLYAPNTAVGSFASSIDLTYYVGFTEYTSTFDTSGAGACPSRTGQTARQYAPTVADLPNASTTYEGQASFTLNVGATPGTYSWTLLLEEPGGTPNPLSDQHTIQVPVTTIYASDQANCGGYGISGISCFQSLQNALDATTATASEVVIVGDLTTGGASTSANSALIRGINSSAQLISAGSCTTNTILEIDDASVTIRDLTIDGSNCSAAAVGINISSTGTVLNNLTVRNFDSGTGINFASGGAGSLRNSNNSILNNDTGLNIASGAGTVNVGTGPSDGSTFTNNTTGISVNAANANIIGNTITGGSLGIELNQDATVQGNSVTGASTMQIYCDTTSWAAAGWNYLGGVAPSAGTNCDNPELQLGAPIVGWDDDGNYGGADDNGAGSLVFQLLGSPYGVDAPGSTVFAIAGGTDVLVPGSETQFKMFMDGTDGLGTDVCFTQTSECWEADAGTTTRAQDGPGYFANSSSDPTAISLTNITAASTSTWLPFALLVGSVALVGGAITMIRKRRA